MKTIFQKILSFSLALIVLFSSISFTVNKHICGGKIAATALFIDADNCGMDMGVCENKSSSSQASLDKEPCCKDVTEFVQANHLEQQAVQATTVEQTAIIFQLINQYVQQAAISTQREQQVLQYRPPLLVKKHTQATLQVFRI